MTSRKKYYIIAGTHEQFLQFTKRKISEGWPNDTSMSLSDFVYVCEPEQLLGVQDPSGFLIGTWYENGRARHILDLLVVRLRDMDRVHELRKAYKTLRDYENSYSKVF